MVVKDFLAWGWEKVEGCLEKYGNIFLRKGVDAGNGVWYHCAR